jgi:hypothetical protein
MTPTYFFLWSLAFIAFVLGITVGLVWKLESSEEEWLAPERSKRRVQTPHPARLALEAMLLSGWIIGVVRWAVLDARRNTEFSFVWIHLYFFTCSTIPLIGLCFNLNTDKAVRWFLLQDFQFKVACVATLWIMSLHAWNLFKTSSSDHGTMALSSVSILLESVFMWSPLIGILQADILRVQSHWFRRIAPFVLVAFLATATVTVRYSSEASSHKLAVIDVRDSGFGRPVMVTASGQIASTASTVLFLLLPQLFSMVRDAHNEYVSFPLQLKMSRELAAVAVRLDAAMEVTGPGLLRQLRSKVEQLTVSLTLMQDEICKAARSAGLEVPLLPQHWSAGLEVPQPDEPEEALVDDLRPRRAWRGAFAFAAFGAMFGVFLSAPLLFLVIAEPPYYTDLAQITGFLVGFTLFGSCGACLLPSGRSPLMGMKRGVLEFMVVAGWVAASISTVMDCLYPDAVHDRTCLQILFMLSSIFFTALAVNNIDWHIVSLLQRQTQFWTLSLLISAMVLVHITGTFRAEDWGDKRPLWHIISAFQAYLPYCFVLFLDSFLLQSKAFRIVLPTAYLMYAATAMVKLGYMPFTRDSHPNNLINISGNVTFGHPVELTDRGGYLLIYVCTVLPVSLLSDPSSSFPPFFRPGILTSLNFTILILMMGYLYAVVVGSNRGIGTLVCFPIKVHLRRVTMHSAAVSRGTVKMSVPVMKDIRELTDEVDWLTEAIGKGSSNTMLSVDSDSSFSLNRSRVATY